MAELLGVLRRLVSGAVPGEAVSESGRLMTTVEGGASGEGDGLSEAAALLAEDDLKRVIPAAERLIIDRVLRRTLGNQSRAARELNLSRGSLIAKIKEYEIPDYRSLRRNR
jgi:transcriptional regulator with PAS, ATPase and Fis domain